MNLKKRPRPNEGLLSPREKKIERKKGKEITRTCHRHYYIKGNFEEAFRNIENSVSR
jgi:hypothetical protein